MRISPRRQLNADRLAAAIMWRGRKVFLGDLYSPMRKHHGMQRYVVDIAADDLYDAGVIEMRAVGDHIAIVLIHPDVDSAVAANSSSRTNRRPFAGRGRA